MQAILRGQDTDPALPAAAVYSVAFSPDGKLVASGDKNGMLRVWDVTTGGLQQQWQGHSGAVCGLAFVSGQASLISAGEDGQLKGWEVGTNRQVWSRATGSPVYAITVSSDQRWLAAGLKVGGVLLYDLETGSVSWVLREYQRAINSLAF
jgi:WD40 repeat protein